MVRVCACHNNGSCVEDGNLSDNTTERFKILPCSCTDGYNGRFCESNFDACGVNPCFPGVECTDLPPPADILGYKCGPCPRGYTGEGDKCSGAILEVIYVINYICQLNRVMLDPNCRCMKTQHFQRNKRLALWEFLMSVETILLRLLLIFVYVEI